MKRTISVMVGRGSVNHNSRKFHAKNTDPERSHLNMDYCNEDIKAVYHELFDEALQRYNDKQSRADRVITDYYEKIRSGKQEKPFHEIILQVGNLEDMNAQSDDGQLAKQVLDEYYQGFRERNPNLRVFSAHLHMDEATPHLHIDFIPFTTGSKRGLDTRVSLKQALAAQGFKGGTRGDTEWSQWVRAEKEQLASVMERHGIEWEDRGTHEKHLSTYEYEKKMRAAEVEDLTEKVKEKQEEMDALEERLRNYEKAEEKVSEEEKELEAPEYQLPDPPALMPARAYKAKFVDGLVEKLKKLVRGMVIRYYEMADNYNRVNRRIGTLYQENEYLRYENQELRSERDRLMGQNKDYNFLRRAFGSRHINEMLEQARAAQQEKQRMKRRNNDRER